MTPRLPNRRRPGILASVLTLAIILGSATLPAQAVTGYSNRFDTTGINGRVFAVGTWNGDLYAGGYRQFLTDGAVLEHLARFDGEAWHDVGGGVGGEVRGIAEYRGELVVAGQFQTAGGRPANSIARWNGSRWATLGTGLRYGFGSAQVFSLQVFQGELYAGGVFDTAGGQPISTLARWDGSTWRSVGNGPSSSNVPKVLDMTSDGNELFVGGEFETAGGRATRHVAAWNGTSWRGFGTGIGTAGSGVHAVALYGGELYAGGTFNPSGPPALRHIARWDTAGASWQPLGLGIPDGGRSSQVNDLVVHDGELAVIGLFSYLDGTSNGQGLFSPVIGRWDGSNWHMVLGRRGGVFRAEFGGDAAGVAATVWNDLLVVGGEFDHGGPIDSHAANVVSRDIIALDGQLFRAVGEGLGLGDGTSGLVEWNESLWSIENHLYAGQALSRSIARFDGARWHPIGPFTYRTKIDDAIVFQGDLHICGDLWFDNGQRLRGVVRYDGSTWTPLGGPDAGTLAVYQGELYCGGLGYCRRLTGGTWTPLPFATTFVQTMQEFGGKLFLGGDGMRTSFGSNPATLMTWDGSSLAAVPGFPDGTVIALHEHNGELWLGGRFQSPSPAAAVFDGTNMRPAPVPTIRGTYVGVFATMRGRLYLSGHLGGVGGTSTSLAVWDGANLTALGSGPNAPATTLLADDETGELWIGGGFFLCDGIPAAGLTIWHDAPRWEDLGVALPRGNGVTPVLEGFGDLVPNRPIALRASGLPQMQSAALVVGLTRIDQPILGGTLVPALDIYVPTVTDPVGGLQLVLQLPPPPLPPGLEVYVQMWGVESSIAEVCATNAIVGR